MNDWEDKKYMQNVG